jgi:outer membrane protein assembly factor BamE (lipoprotein component of BamABCDE complex)
MRKPVYVNDGFDDRWYYIMEIKQKRFGVDEYTEVELIQA